MLLRALVVTVQCHGNYGVEYLTSGSSKVGLEVTPNQHEIADDITRRWVRVDVKFVGISEPWEYFDDCHFEPEPDDVFEDLVLNTVLTPAHIDGQAIEPDDVGSNAEVQQYLPIDLADSGK